MTQPTPPDGEPDRELYGDRPYTIRATLISLLIGVPIAALIAFVLIRLNQAPTVQGQTVRVTVGALGVPLALVASGIVLFGAVFILPMRIARRANRVLDPGLYPMMGVLSVAAILTGAFVLAILFSVI